MRALLNGFLDMWEALKENWADLLVWVLISISVGSLIYSIVGATITVTNRC